ncbi:MAG: DUF6049 family protein, partial [Actinomycetes bacterium]
MKETARRLAAASLCWLIVCGGTALATSRDEPPTSFGEPAQGLAGLTVQVFVDTLTPRVVRPHTLITVAGRLVNASSEAVGDVRVRLRVRSRAVGSRSELAGDAVRSEPLGEPLESTTTPIATSLNAAATIPFSLTVAADDLHFGAFGVYPFAVEVLGSDAGGPNDIVGRAPTFVPWVPAGGGFTPTRLAWIMPLVDAPDRGATAVFPDDHLAGSLAGRGRLNALLAAASRAGPGSVHAPPRGRKPPPDAQRAVQLTWAVDPALLQSVADMSDGYRVQTGNGNASAPGAGQAAAGTWLTGLRRLLRAGPLGDSLLALPYANVDVP